MELASSSIESARKIESDTRAKFSTKYIWIYKLNELPEKFSRKFFRFVVNEINGLKLLTVDKVEIGSHTSRFCGFLTFETDYRTYTHATLKITRVKYLV